MGTSADASHVRRAFRKVTEAASLNPGDWTPRESRHSLVSLLSDAGVPIEQIHPVISDGAEVMDCLFPRDSPGAEPEVPDA